jgi:hypothetical protein
MSSEGLGDLSHRLVLIGGGEPANKWPGDVRGGSNGQIIPSHHDEPFRPRKRRSDVGGGFRGPIGETKRPGPARSLVVVECQELSLESIGPRHTEAGGPDTLGQDT